MKKLAVAVGALAACVGLAAGIAVAVTGSPSVAAVTGSFDLKEVPGHRTSHQCTGQGGVFYVSISDLYRGTLTSSDPTLNGLRDVLSGTVTINLGTGDAVGTFTNILRTSAGQLVGSGKLPAAGHLNGTQLDFRGLVDVALRDASGTPTGAHVIANVEGALGSTAGSHVVGSFGGAASNQDFAVTWNGFTC
jgi:hypothetical protein